jgi:hypothetical protein
MLDEKRANPTVDGSQGDGAEVPGIEAPGTEGADNPKFALLDTIFSCRERMKLSPYRVTADGYSVWQQLTVDDNAGGRNLHSVTGPFNNGLDER